MCSAYGLNVGNITYDEFVGLHLNLKRTMRRKAYMQAVANGISGSFDYLEYDWFDAIEDTEEEARELCWKTNSERATAMARISKGIG